MRGTGVIALAMGIGVASAALAADPYVSLPKSVICTFNFGDLMNSNGGDMPGVPKGISGSINRMQCWTLKSGQSNAKELVLASSDIRDGFIESRDFGPIKLVMTSTDITGLRIQKAKLGTLISFLGN